jgi:hypothetical protein
VSLAISVTVDMQCIAQLPMNPRGFVQSIAE